MAELIGGLTQVRDGLSLMAFLSLVVLFALRTPKVPALMSRMLRTVPPQDVSALLRRFMTLGFVAFLVSASLAVIAQALNQVTQPGVLTIEDLRTELAAADAPDAEKIQVEALYRLAMEKLSQRDFDAAIDALRKTIDAIPTLTAREMLVHLYRLTGDANAESSAWAAAVETARERGDTLAMIRLDRIGAPDAAPLEAEGEQDLIGNSRPLPDGGDTFETAAEMSPGLYSCMREDHCHWRWFRRYLRSGQSLDVRFRSPPAGGLAGISVYDTNGKLVAQGGDGAGAMRGNAGPRSSIYDVNWTATSNGWYFVSTHADRGTVFRVRGD